MLDEAGFHLAKAISNLFLSPSNSKAQSLKQAISIGLHLDNFEFLVVFFSFKVNKVVLAWGAKGGLQIWAWVQGFSKPLHFVVGQGLSFPSALLHGGADVVNLSLNVNDVPIDQLSSLQSLAWPARPVSEPGSLPASSSSARPELRSVNRAMLKRTNQVVTPLSFPTSALRGLFASFRFRASFGQATSFFPNSWAVQRGSVPQRYVVPFPVSALKARGED